MKAKKLFSAPLGIYLSWIILFILYFCIVIPITISTSQSSFGTPFIFIMYGLMIFVIGIFLIGLFIPIIFFQWFKRYWYVSIGITLITLCLILYVKTNLFE
jgi:hypothetical protein